MSSFSATLYIMARKCYIRWDDNDIYSVLDQHAESDIYSASSLKQQFFVTRHVASLWNNILIFDKNSLQNIKYNNHVKVWT